MSKLQPFQIRQNQYAKSSRDKAKEIGRPEGRVYHVAYFETLEKEFIRLTECGDDAEIAILERIISKAISSIVAMGFERDQVTDKRMTMIQNLDNKKSDLSPKRSRPIDAQAEAARKQKHDAQLRSEMSDWEAKYAIRATEMVGLWQQMADNHMRIKDRIEHLVSIDVKIPDDLKQFEKDLKRVFTIVSELGDKPMISSKKRSPKPKNKAAKKTTTVHKDISRRIQSLVNSAEASADSSMPPYPSRTYQASAAEMSQVGFETVERFVSAVNEVLLNAKQHPVTVGDYPTNKRNFERLVKRWQIMTNDRAEKVSSDTPRFR